MNLFVDYVQPLTLWLQANPHWSLFITFVIALTESLAIIGSIVPGSVTMTAIGILAGSGIMRVDLTLIAAALGAVAGDSLSYALGYFYSEQLVDMWPFKRYPNLLRYGKEFFARHGGKSVLIGRFVGPLRSIIPVIAGIMHMKQWRFLIANVISAIGWSILYVIPGVLIGAAGHELSAETATRLFLIILILLAGIWLTSLLIKWLLIKINTYLRSYLHYLWLSLKGKPFFGAIYEAFTPHEEENHYPTAGLLLLAFLTLLCFIGILVLTLQADYLDYINSPVNLFAQSFHTPLFEMFFICCTQLTSTITLTGLYLSCCSWCFYQRNLKLAVYLSSIILSTLLISSLLSHYVISARPSGLLVTLPGSSFPAAHLAIATAFYGFLLFYINNKYSLLTSSLKTIILVILGLSGFATVYLGDYWFTDVLAAYLIGTTLCLVHCIVYRKYNAEDLKLTHATGVLISLLGIIFSFTVVSTYFNYRTAIHDHTPYHEEYSLFESTWWDQQSPMLPLYRLNRIGKRISILNIQYDGDLALLQSKLADYGWETHSETFLTKILMRMNGKTNQVRLPLLAQLYQNKRPELIMTYKDPKSNMILELTIWESNYNLYGLNRSIWIGTVHQNSHNGKPNDASNFINSLSYMIPALDHFVLRRVELPKAIMKSTSFPTAPYILLIREQQEPANKSLWNY